MNSEVRRGTAAVGAAYLLWGLFPLYFHLLRQAGAIEVLAHRIVWSVLVCTLAVAFTRGWNRLTAVLRAPRLSIGLSLGAIALSINWGVYVYAVANGHVVEASLGYFINPLVTILLGVVILHERLRRAQWVAVGIAAVAVTVLTLDYGRVPYIALTLAVSFGLYGLVKKQVGASVDALSGMTVETLAVFLPAAGYLIWLGWSGTANIGPAHLGLTGLLSLSGFITVGPLLLFAAAARRIPLSTIGLMQYITPVMQFLLGVTVFGEHLPLGRLAGFSLVWLALAVLAVDGLRAGGSSVRARAGQVRITAAEGTGVQGIGVQEVGAREVGA